MKRIQSTSDIITNSSSEVFVVHGPKDILKTIESTVLALAEASLPIYKKCRYPDGVEDILYTTFADDSGTGYGWEITHEKGDLIIHSASDNSIPYWLMKFIEDCEYDTWDSNKGGKQIEVKREHLG